VRTVKVGLEADVRGFNEPLDRAKSKVDGLKDKTEGLDRSINKLPADSAKAGAGLKLLGEAGEAAGRSAKDLGTKLDGAGDQASQLARKLLEAKAAAKLAAAEFDGTEASIKRLRQAQADFNTLAAVARNVDVGVGKSRKSLLDTVLPDSKSVARMGAESAGTFASAFQGGLMGTFRALPPEAKAALGASIAGVAIAAAPFVVSAINGALLAGIGAGGLAAGIAVQLQDPVVMGAFQRVGDHIQSTLKDSTSSFRAPLLAAADDLDKSFVKIRPNIKGMFEGLAPSIGTLGKAAAKSIETLGPALEKAAGPAAMVLDAIAAELPEIAQQLGFLLESISEHGESAAAAVKFIFFNVEALIGAFNILVKTVGPAADGIVRIAKAFGLIDDDKLDKALVTLDKVDHSAKAHVETQGKMLRTLDETGAGFSRFGGQADGAAENVGKVTMAAEQSGKGFSRASGEVEVWSTTTGALASQARDAQNAIEYMNREVYNTADAADQANEAFGRLFGEMMGLDEANLKVAEDFRKLGAEIRKNKGSLDENTEAGQKNRKFILGMVEDLNRQREAEIAAGNGTVEATRKANKAFLEKLQRVRDLTVANGGNTASVDAMLAKYRELANIPAINKTITLTTIYRTKGDKYGSAFVEVVGHGFDRADAPGRASGGPVTRGAPYLVGEHGPEFFVPSTDGAIVDAAATHAVMSGAPQSRAMELAQTVGNGYGFDAVPRGGGGGAMALSVELRIIGNDRALGGLLMEMQRKGDLQFVVAGR
jgi:hypothetical protein